MSYLQSPRFWGAVVGALLGLWPYTVPAAEAEGPVLVQVMYGKMVVANDEGDVGGGDFNIPLFGAAVQKAFGGDFVHYGIETGGLFNWQNDIRSWHVSGGGSGGSAAVALDINGFIFDYFFGGYASVTPVPFLRLYLGGGPLLIYGYRKSENSDAQTSVKETTSDSGFGVGAYARAGLELILTDHVIFGAGVRGTRTSLALKDASGKVDIEGWQYFGGVSFRF